MSARREGEGPETTRGGTGRRERHGHAPLVPDDPMEESEEELRFHLDMRTRDYRDRGMSEDEATEAARERLGDVDGVRRELGALARHETRAERRREWLSELRQDVAYGLRVLARAPTFAAMSVTTLAMGIGATTAIFSLVYAVLLEPLPYAQPDRLVRVWETSPQGATRNVVSAGNVTDWQQRARSFSVMGAHREPFGLALTGDGEAAMVVVGVVQPEVLRALDVRPTLGRSLVPEDAVAGNVALVSHATWQGRYSADPAVIGRPVVVNDQTFTIVGVMPADFAFPSPEVELWLPLTRDQVDPNSRTSHNFEVVARLAPGATLEGAQAELSAIAARIAQEHPSEMTGWGARVVPLREDITRDVESLFRVLLGGVAVVLLIACGNLANLLLARALGRRREMALRGALGAGRARILRQLLTESSLLALLGGVGAVVIAPVLLRALVSAAPASVPLLDGAAIDLRMLGFTAAVALGSALLFGLAPAMSLSRSDLESPLRSGRDASQAGHLRLRSALLVAQVALSVVLLVGAGLFVRSFRSLQATELGYEPAGLVLMDLNLPGRRYPGTDRQVQLYDRLLARVAEIPGVVAVASTSQPPAAGSGMTFSFAIEGRTATNPSGREDDETLHAITPGYFEALGQRIVAGRAFDRGDRADGTPVVILNRSLARKHFPEGDALGHRIAFREGETPWLEIVGIAADTRLESPDVPPDPGIFIPYGQKSWPWLTWSTVVARTAPGTDPAAIAPGLRAALEEVDPQLPPESIRTVASAVRARTAQRSFSMLLVSGFGVLALVLSVVGLHGLISYSVARQRREIGVRIALGAASGAVVGQVLRRSLALTLAGAAIGVVAAAGASRLIEGLLFGVSPVDATTYATTVALVIAVALATAALPALRASRTDPVGALAGE